MGIENCAIQIRCENGHIQEIDPDDNWQIIFDVPYERHAVGQIEIQL
jgi:hypothetical protein